MSRSYQKIIAWGRAKSSRSHRTGHYDKKETRKSRDHNGKYIGCKKHWMYKLQTIQDYKNDLMDCLSNPANFENIFSIAKRTTLEKFRQFCKEKFNGEMTEEAIEAFATMQYKKDRSK